ncbi:hypothetical protein EUX98_g7503 [Antrodiella citrinella]|uniref:Uncharacterized protein n=1 Tax=Antrodiella citrinella TaxID=2447956 RepID=A0A4S4MLC9_9APHY|nr:hypothetical protein EUX98_g7503 [Antrodiella citrinella]
MGFVELMSRIQQYMTASFQSMQEKMDQAHLKIKDKDDEISQLKNENQTSENAAASTSSTISSELDRAREEIARLQGVSSTASATIDKKTKQLESIRDEMTKLKRDHTKEIISAIEAKTTAQDELAKQKQDRLKEKTQAVEAKASVTKKYNALLDQKTAVEAKIVEQNTEITRLQSEKTTHTIRSELQAAKNEAERVQALLDASSAEKTRAEEDAKAARDELEARISTLQNDINRLKAAERSMKEIQANLDKALQEKSHISGLLEGLKESDKTQESKMTTLRTELAASQANHVTISAARDDAVAKVTALKTEISQQAAEITRLDTEKGTRNVSLLGSYLVQLTNDLRKDALRSELQAAKNEAERVQALLDVSSAEKTRAEEDAKAARDELEARISTLQNDINRLKAAERSMKEIQANLDKVLQEKSHISGLLEGLKESDKTQESKMTTLRTELAASQAKQITISAARDDALLKVTALKAEITQRAVEKRTSEDTASETLRTQNQSASEQAARLQGLLDASQMKEMQAVEKFEALYDVTIQLEADVLAKTNAISCLQEEKSNAFTLAQEEITKWKEASNNAGTQGILLQELVKDLTSEKESLSTQLIEMTSQRKDVEQQLASTKAELSIAAESDTRRTMEIGAIQTQLMSKESEVAKLQHLVDQLKKSTTLSSIGEFSATVGRQMLSALARSRGPISVDYAAEVEAINQRRVSKYILGSAISAPAISPATSPYPTPYRKRGKKSRRARGNHYSEESSDTEDHGRTGAAPSSSQPAPGTSQSSAIRIDSGSNGPGTSMPSTSQRSQESASAAGDKGKERESGPSYNLTPGGNPANTSRPPPQHDSSLPDVILHLPKTQEYFRRAGTQQTYARNVCQRNRDTLVRLALYESLGLINLKDAYTLSSASAELLEAYDRDSTHNGPILKDARLDLRQMTTDLLQKSSWNQAYQSRLAQAVEYLASTYTDRRFGKGTCDWVGLVGCRLYTVYLKITKLQPREGEDDLSVVARISRDEAAKNKRDIVNVGRHHKLKRRLDSACIKADECRANGDPDGEEFFHHAMEVVDRLGVDGMSEEESGMAEVTVSGMTLPSRSIKKVKKLEWRSEAAGKILHTIDELRDASERPFGQRGRNAFVRVPHPQPSQRPPPKGLTVVMYDADWISRLREHEVERLQLSDEDFVLFDIGERV